MTRPSILRVISRCLRAPRSLVHWSLIAPRDSCLLEPPSDTTNFLFRTVRPPIVTIAESLENDCLETRDHEKIGSDATITEEEASAHACWKRRRFVANRTAAMGRHSEKNLSFLELPSRSEKLCSLPPGLARVSLAHFGRRQSARRGRRGRRGAYFNEKYRLECSSSAGATIFWSSGSTEDTSCHAAIAPSRVLSATRRRGAGILTCGAHGQC